jgi:hypothetical protein
MSVPEGRVVHAATDESAIHFDLMLYGDAYADGEVEGAGLLLPLLREAIAKPLDHAAILGL